jgi:hypothetical protein
MKPAGGWPDRRNRKEGNMRTIVLLVIVSSPLLFSAPVAACTGEAGSRPAPAPITVDQDEIMEA